MDTMLRGIYSGMLAKLKTGNTNGALTAVTGGVYQKYQTIFTTLAPSLATAVDQLGDIVGGNITGEMAEYVLVRNIVGGQQAFLIYFLKGEDGVWRIDGM